MTWTPDSIREMAKRMEARPAGFRVSAATAPLIIEAVRFLAREGCAEPMTNGFSVDVWDSKINSIEEHMAMARTLSVGIAAYEATLLMRPSRIVMLRHGIRVIRSSGRREA